MKNALQKFGRTTALAFAFALAAGAGQQAAAQDSTAAYMDVQQRLAPVEDIAKQIQMTKHTQEVLGLPQNAAEIAELKAALKKGADAVAPRIVLTPGLTAVQTQNLVDEFAAKIGPLPDYLAKINHKTKLVNVCTQELIPDDNVYTTALATSIANCVAAKKVVDTPAPVAAETVALPPVAAAPAPVKTEPVTKPVPVVTPAADNKTPATVTTTTEAKSSGFNPLAPINLGIEFGGAALLLGGGVLLFRRKPAPQAPETPATKAVADDTPPKKPKSFNL